MVHCISYKASMRAKQCLCFNNNVIIWHQSAVGSMAVDLLLLIPCFMYHPLFVRILCLVLFSYALHNVISNFAIIMTSMVALPYLSF